MSISPYKTIQCLYAHLFHVKALIIHQIIFQTKFDGSSRTILTHKTYSILSIVLTSQYKMYTTFQISSDLTSHIISPNHSTQIVRKPKPGDIAKCTGQKAQCLMAHHKSHKSNKKRPKACTANEGTKSVIVG